MPDGFISILLIVGRGDVLDLAWVVSSDGKVIGRVTYLNYLNQKGKGGRGLCWSHSFLPEFGTSAAEIQGFGEKYFRFK